MKPDASQPGFKNILLDPHCVKGLDSFSASHDGPFGEILSSWKRAKNTVVYNLVIPANSTATLKLSGKKISLGGKVISENTDQPLVQNLEAGKYEFEIVQ
jgi:alpha-L-rhamnosidase